MSKWSREQQQQHTFNENHHSAGKYRYRELMHTQFFSISHLICPDVCWNIQKFCGMLNLCEAEMERHILCLLFQREKRFFFGKFSWVTDKETTQINVTGVGGLFWFRFNQKWEDFFGFWENKFANFSEKLKGF